MNQGHCRPSASSTHTRCRQAIAASLQHARRHTDATQFSQAFQASGHVHSVVENVTVLDDYVALVDADPELDAVFGRSVRIPLVNASLSCDRTAQRIHHTAKLDQEPVAG